VKALVVFAHPSAESFVGALRDAVIDELNRGGHEVRQRDLYEEGFSPVFTAYERTHHVGDLDVKLSVMPELRSHVEDLRWCDTLVLVYPTWWSAQPAILKGWIDRVFMNQVAWVLPEGAARISPLLTNVRRVVVVTTHGSSKLVNALQGESGKRIAFRSIRVMFHPRARTNWVGVYGLDSANDAERAHALIAVQTRLRRIFS
jgi:NAD(P)H dehydrogenase (quinone)